MAKKEEIDKDFVSYSPKDGTLYEIKNHNGAVMGFAVYKSAYWWFVALNDWPDYSSAQLKEIAKILDKLNDE